MSRRSPLTELEIGRGLAADEERREDHRRQHSLEVIPLKRGKKNEVALLLNQSASKTRHEKKKKRKTARRLSVTWRGRLVLNLGGVLACFCCCCCYRCFCSSSQRLNSIFTLVVCLVFSFSRSSVTFFIPPS